MSLVTCPECQSENRLGDESCNNCGASLPTEALQPADTDWLSDLSDMIASVQPEEDEALAPEGLPDWLQAEHPEQEDTTVKEEDDLLAWLRDIKPTEAAEGEGERAEDESPVWLERATGSPQKDVVAPPGEQAEETPVSAVSEPLDSETHATAGESEEPLPAWVSELTSPEEWAETGDDAAVADWIAHQDEEEKERPSPELPMTQPLNPTKELRGVPQQLASDSLPEWLSDQIEEMPDDSGIAAESLDQGRDASEAANAEHAERLKSDEEGELAETIPGAAASPARQAGVLPLSPSDEWITLLEDTPLPADDSIDSKVDEISPLDAMQVHNADIPEWLLALKPGASSVTASAASTLPAENSGPLAGLRGVIPVAPVIAGIAQEPRVVSYEESKEQQQQIALLRQLTTVGPDTEDKVIGRSSSAMFATVRILLGGALLIFAVLGWLLPSLGVALPLPAPAEVPEAAGDAYSTLNNASGQTALVAFEYTPALAGELDAVAGTFLRHLADNGSPVITVSQSAAGSAVAERAVAEAIGLESHSLGFIPGEAIGLRQLADCLENSGACRMVSSRSVDEDVQAGLEEVSLIIVLAGERDGLSNWIEQVGSQSDSAMVAGVAQQLGPVAAPYQASEQLSGYLNGLPAAAAYEQRLRGNEEYAVEWLTSLTLVHWLVIAVLAVGSLYFGAMGLASTRARKSGM